MSTKKLEQSPSTLSRGKLGRCFSILRKGDICLSNDTGQKVDLLTDEPAVRAPSEMPPLLSRLSEMKPETLDYLGVSYGLTPQLLRWGFAPD